jgi:Carboxypeptidase regulatory-like domain
MMKMRPFMLITKKTSSLNALIILVLALAPAMPANALAQINQQNGPVNRGPQERIAEGKVVNKTGVAIGGAVVFLKNSRSNSVKTYIADDSGHFRFGELAQDTDYELWAESNGVRSKSREISSFDSENNFYFTLKVDSTKGTSIE